MAYPTPASAHLVAQFDAFGGVQVTASHRRIAIQDFECGDGGTVYAQWYKAGNPNLQGLGAPCGSTRIWDEVTDITSFRKCVDFGPGEDHCHPFLNT
jgi:hypothetical protein